MPFSIAIIGRPNVGKSTLFNRMAGKRLALVDDTPGVTRDRRDAEAQIGPHDVRLIDTAGLEEATGATLEARMRRQSEAAIAEADIILFVIDARVGVTPVDAAFADQVRVSGKPVILAANKCEGRAGEAGFYEAYGLGLGDPVAISAEHGEGIADLYSALADALETLEHAKDETGPTVAVATDRGGDVEDEVSAAEANRPLRVAIVGRPNAGKSTLINALIGEDRMITGPEAGITRDSVAVELTRQGRALKLYDTAGLRKKARVQERVEKLSVGDALRAIRFAETVVVLLDAQNPLEKQDLTIADLVAREGRAVVIAVNKWDLVHDKTFFLKQLRQEVERLLPQIKGVPVVPVSALSGKGLDVLMEAVFQTDADWNKRIPTSRLNNFLEEAVSVHTPPAVGGKRIRLRYMTQPNARPPTFIVFCSRPKDLPQAYVRYLINGLRKTFDLPGIPIRLHVRKGKNPYA